MFTPDVTPDYFDQFVASSKMNNSLVSSTFLSPAPSNFSDSSYQQSPLSVYNNYNPNYHHHHYYFHPNFQDYGYGQAPSSYHDGTTSWLKKFDFETQKEYYISNTPPSDCVDFEVPQRASPSPKPAIKLITDLDKIFFDDQIVSRPINNLIESCDPYTFWNTESCASGKPSGKRRKSEGKPKSKISKTVKMIVEKGDWLFVSINVKEF